MYAQATYLNVTFYTPEADDSDSASQIVNSQMQIEVLNASGASISFFVDNQPVSDENGEPSCQNLITDYAGIVECKIIYVKNPYTSDPPAIKLDDWPQDALLTARLQYSNENPQIKPSISSPVLISTNNNPSQQLYTTFLMAASTPKNMLICLPLIIIFGLLIASLQYAGKNPLSLFDITVPRLPNLKKVRMKSPTIPLQLNMMGRMSARVIARNERAIESSLLALYLRSGKSSGSLKQVIRDMFPRRPILGSAKAYSDAGYDASLAKLRSLIDSSGADKKYRDIAWAAIMRNMEIRQTLIIGLKTTSAARAGQFSNRASTISGTLDLIGTRLAKPWKLIPSLAKNERLDALPGLPYVERTFLVAQNWIGSKYSNLSLRRALVKTLVAETARSLGANPQAKFIRDNIFDHKKIGDIPHIIERLRQESYILGRAIVDEYARALMMPIVLKKGKGENEYSLDTNALKNVLAMIKSAQEKIDSDVRSGRIDSTFREYYLKEEMMRRLADYIQKNKVAFYDATGSQLSQKEVGEFVKNYALAYAQKAREIIMADGVSTADGRYPSLTDSRANKLNPEDVYSRYNQLVAMLGASSKQLAQGKIPLVMLGHDMTDLFGKAVNIKVARQQLQAQSEVEKLQQIRYMMEAELMKKQLFDYITGSRALLDNYNKKIEPLLGQGILNNNWLAQLDHAISLKSIRDLADYSRRGEWAARNYLTAHYSYNTDFLAETEKNNLSVLRQLFSSQFDRGYEDLFRNYDVMIRRNQMTYQSMKSVFETYMPGQKWDAAGYQAWKEKGVTYADIKKGVWIIDARQTIIPLASGFDFDKDGAVRSARCNVVNGRLTYDHTVIDFLGSDYAERPVNASYMIKTADGRWRPGTPTDPETATIVRQLKSYYAQLSSLKFGEGRFADYTADGKVSDAAANMDASVRGLSRKQILENIELLQNQLKDRMRLVPRSAIADDMTQPFITRFTNRAAQFAERVARGGVNDVDNRLQEWLASQFYARISLETFSRDFDRGLFNSPEVQDSFNTKKDLTALRQKELALMEKSRLSSDERAELNNLRNVLIPQQIQLVRQNEALAMKTQKELGWVDRDLKRVSSMLWPFYYVGEQTVMRDPRITFGSAYGLDPAVMTGYQTGQFVSEHPQMWAGIHLYPGDRMLNFLARPSYYAASAYGMWTRTFFTKMTGYTTVYHMDPEQGHNRTPHHEPGVITAFQSMFKPSQSFDWLTRTFVKPMVRTKFRNEYGWNLKDEESWVGPRYNLPFSLKSSEAGTIYPIDKDRLSLLNIDAADELRRRKLGLTFREEFQLWNKRYDATQNYDFASMMSSLKQNLSHARDGDERKMISARIRELEDISKTERATWKIPIVRDFFRQGYYAVENRSGYDVNTIGAAHRPNEMVTPWHKNINKAPTPGQFFTDWDGHMHMYPYVTHTLANIIQKGGGIKQDSPMKGLEGKIGPERPELLREGKVDEYMAKSGVGRHLQSEALRDVYRREIPLMLQFVEVEGYRQMFQYHNSPYIFPLAPVYVLAYQVMKRTIPSMRNAAWSSSPPKAYGELTPEERAHENAMRMAQTQAQLDMIKSYSCPTHGIHLNTSESCPLCRTQAEVDMARSHSWLKDTMRRKSEYAKNWALSAISLGGTIPIGNYNHYFNATYCPHHSIPHPRGAPCPLCLEKSLEQQGINRSVASDINRRIRDVNKDIEKTFSDKSIDEQVRMRELENARMKKQEILREYNLSLEMDRRDFTYKHSYEYLKNSLKVSSDNDKKYGYTIKIS